MLQILRMLFIKGGSPYTKVVSENAKAPILLAISRFVNKGKIKTVLPMRLVWINQTQKFCAKSAFTKSIDSPQALIDPWWWRSRQRLQRSASWRSWLKSAACKTRDAIECSLSHIRLCPA
jgi:hypothetical protein